MNMKIKLLLIALTLSVSANAQEKTELDVFKHTAIDTTQLIVSYDLTVKYDLSGQNNPDFEKVYTYIGRKVCQSFVESEHNADLRMAKAFLRNGKRGSRAAMKLVANVGETYIGYPKGKTTVIYNMDGAGSYLYQEATPKMQWKITTEHKNAFRLRLYSCNLFLSWKKL